MGESGCRRKSTTVLGSVRVDGYQIQDAGARSRRCSGAGRLIAATAGGESGRDGVFGAAIDGTSPRTAPAPAVRFKKSRRLVMECRSLMSMEETDDNVKVLKRGFGIFRNIFFRLCLTIQPTLRNIPMMKRRFTDGPLRGSSQRTPYS